MGDVLSRHGINTRTERNLFVLTIDHYSIYDGLFLDILNDLLQMLPE